MIDNYSGLLKVPMMKNSYLKEKITNNISSKRKDINMNNDSMSNNSENTQTQNQTSIQSKSKNINIQNISNETQTSFSMLSKDKDQENNIEMVYIIDKDKNFEESNILNTFDIKLNVHIDHSQKDKIYFYDYDFHEEQKNNIYKFKCSDSNCTAIYNLSYFNTSENNDNMNNNINSNENFLFNKIKEHSIPFEQHNYYINPTKGQNKYQEILNKYPTIKHIQIISVPDNFDYSSIPSINSSDKKEEEKNNDDEYINVEENEDEKYSLESDYNDKNNKVDKEDDDDYYSNSSSYKARSRNKQQDNKKKLQKKNKINKETNNANINTINHSTNNSTRNAPKSKKYENKILEDYEKYMQSGVKQVKKKRQQLYYKPQEYTKWVLSMKNSKYVYAYLPYYKKGREALGKSKAREKWMRYMTFKYGEETTLGPIYYKDKSDGRIYKFAVNNLSSDADNRKVTYSCHRESCQGRGILNVEEDLFIITEPHSLRKSLCTDIKRHQAIVDYYNAHPDIVFIQTLRQFMEKK